MKTLFIIQDWAGNHLFKDQTFESFEDGWNFISINVDNSDFDKSEDDDDDEYQEYFVVPQK